MFIEFRHLLCEGGSPKVPVPITSIVYFNFINIFVFKVFVRMIASAIEEETYVAKTDKCYIYHYNSSKPYVVISPF